MKDILSLQDELQRMILMSNYKQSNTLTENYQKLGLNEKKYNEGLNSLILEQGAIVRDIVGTGAKEVKLASTLKAAEELRAAKEFKIATQDLKAGVKDAELLSGLGKEFKTVDEVMAASKDLAPAVKGKFVWNVAKNVEAGTETSKNLAREIATTPANVRKYMDLPESALKDAVMAKTGNAKFADEVVKEFNIVKETGLSKEVGLGAKDTKTIAGDTKTIAGDTKTASIEGKTAEKELDDISREIEASKGRADVMKKEAELNKQLKLEAQEAKKLAESGEALGKAVKEGKSGGVLKWLKESKFIQWTKKIIFNKYVLALAAIYGGYLLWKKFFGDNGITIEDDGTTASTGGGDSVSGGSGTGTGGGTSPETQQWLNDPQAGDGETGDPNMSKYVACMKEPYKLWCSDPMGSPVIKKLQQCVGQKPTGFWGTKTEEAVKRKGIWGKTTLSFNEIKSGCLVGQTW